MTKKFYLIIFAAAGLLLSCNKENDDVPTGKPVSVTIADASQAGNENWKNGDQIKAIFDNVAATLTNKSADGQPASFKGTVKSDKYSLVKAFAPASAFTSKGTGTTANIAIAAGQKPSLAGVDPKADFWVATPMENVTVVEGTALSTSFSRASAIVKVVLTDNDNNFTGKTVTGVSLETKTVSIAGEAVIDLAANGDISCSGDKLVSAAYDNGFAIDGTNAVWFAVAPATLDAEEVITISVAVGEENVSMKINCGKANITGFAAGETTTISVNVEDSGFNGEGTEAEPWEISNYAELCKFSAAVAKGEFNTGYFKLTDNITVPADQVFTPIGKAAEEDDDPDRPFNGVFDGNGKTITGLKLPDVENAALFGFVGKPAENEPVKVEIKNLTIDALTFEAKAEKGHAAIVGGASKHGEIVISNCTVKNSTIESAGTAAGIIAKVAGVTTISGCKVLNTAISGDGSTVGGIVATITIESPKKVKIENCVVGSKSSVTGTKHSVGGILGTIPQNKTADFTIGEVVVDKCAVYCNVKGGTQVIGGIVGGAGPCPASSETHTCGGTLIISNCIYQGGQLSTDYTNDANAYLGGIFGGGSRVSTPAGASVYIINCASRPGSVISKVGPNTARWSFGGIAGGMFAYTHIWNCWSDITEAKLDLYSGNLGYGAITTQMQPATADNSIDYVFGVIKLKNSGSGKIDNHDESDLDSQPQLVPANMTEAQLTDGTLLGKLAAGCTAYTGGKATLSEWSTGASNYPAMSTTPADPDK